MTHRIYYTDASRREFDATVVDLTDDGRRVYLDSTAFYPTSGGQAHDLGMIGGVPVVDVVDEGVRIAHLLAEPLPEALSRGQPVHGTIDWPRRFDHMQQHTGQHLLSAVFQDLFGYRTASVHFSPESSTLDLDTASLSRDQSVRAEWRANEVVAENRPVGVGFEDAEGAAGLRKATDRGGTLRIVTIEGLDRSACGGTHVAATGAVGAIVLRRIEHVRKSTRVEFLCGGRAVRRARADFEALAAVAGGLSASMDDVPTLVASQAEQLRDTEQTRRRLEREIATFRAGSLYAVSPPASNGLRCITLRSAAGGMEELKVLAQATLELPRAVIVASLAGGTSILVAATEDSGVDAGRLLKDALARVQGRGGGSPRLAQGSAPVERHEELFRVLTDLISEGAPSTATSAGQP